MPYPSRKSPSVVVNLVCAKGVIRCMQREREALLHLKVGLVDKYGMLSSWTSADCCQWKGIVCSNITGHVLTLDLHGDWFAMDEFFISGNINKSLMELQHLKVLNLSWNQFQGNHVPDFIASLKNLRYLDLSNSGFGGRIPSQLGSLSHLNYLNLGGNSLEGSIPYQLGNLSRLQHLDLRGNSLEGNVPSQLGNLLHLQKLYLGYCEALKIDGEGLWLSNLTSLTHLDLSLISNLNNSHSLLQIIGTLPKLEELSLSDCSLSDHFIHSLNPLKFNYSTSLSVFDLSWNTFTSFMIFQLVSNISSNLVELDLCGNNLLEAPTSNHFGMKMHSLERIDLSSNRLRGGVLESFMNICTIQYLNIYGNNITRDLPSIVHNLSGGCARYSLQELFLSYNQIIGSLPDFSTFSSLKTLDLSVNRLSGKIPEGSKLPPQLESLSIESNSLEGGVPKSFGRTCTLHSLHLSNNSLNEELPVIIHHLSGCARFSLQELNGKIPEDIRFPTQLETLEMNSNSLGGVISDSHFANMSKLKLLELSDNSLALEFSQNFAPSFQLGYIKLRSCKLGPTFPKWFQTQNDIEILDISNCGISDFVPEWFWSKVAIQGMTRMNISFNNLKGTIPNFPLEITPHFLILASNQFEGPIPPFLRGSAYLDLSQNNFSDCFSFLCGNDTVEALGQLDLSNNQLSGQIPDCWNHFKSLAYLDLSHNNFSGTIPISMGSLLELQALLLSSNSLTKEIPRSLSSCTKLVMLDLGENKLSGPIPSWIGDKLQKLQILSLRKNHFSGSLPLQLCYLKGIQLLDLSLNNLSGRIPKCLKNLTAMSQKTSLIDYTHQGYFVSVRSVGQYMNYYDLYSLLTWKGAEQIFLNNELLLLKSIDLSSNHLSEEIPIEIESLFELISLNLSRNNLTGEIPSNIGRLTSLEFLDLSRNKIYGPIPCSLTQIDRLTMLDLSHNHLSGEIPIGTQLQSFDATSYEDNLNLCGKPLEKLCVVEEPPDKLDVEFDEDENFFVKHPLYASMAFGFITGFGGVFVSILVNRTWRQAYCRLLDNLTDHIYLIIVTKVAK
ncbi:hypothetical protein Fmac_016019 [Flemingia macrophylla]|uniref:Leucine-rich repeat-containing N-terminal plant-type domain-containing protein n=1 Tax=Flemingia macrophylla TaxID=520843 RepID=A0ABD1MG93_9FABA